MPLSVVRLWVCLFLLKEVVVVVAFFLAKG